MWRKTKFWIVLFSALVVLGGGAFLLLRGADTGARTARISLDGEVYEEIDLNAVAMPYDIRIETELGYNIVHVEHGAISVSEADCPDQVCVDQGWISDGTVPVVCLPNRLVIQIEGGGDGLDSATG